MILSKKNEGLRGLKYDIVNFVAKVIQSLRKSLFCEFKIVSSTIKNLSSKIYLMALKRFFILENSARKIIYELLKAKICLKNIGFKASPPSLRLRVL